MHNRLSINAYACWVYLLLLFFFYDNSKRKKAIDSTFKSQVNWKLQQYWKENTMHCLRGEINERRTTICKLELCSQFLVLLYFAFHERNVSCGGRPSKNKL